MTASAQRERRTVLATAGILVAIAVVAVVLRAWDLGHNPPELFEDELSGAASAWSIATTGHDVGSTHLPFLVTRLEMKLPIYGFSTVPFQAVLGQTVLAVRIPAVLWGTVSTVLVFWLARTLGRRRVEALLAAAVFAVVPWAVHYGRIGWEPASVLAFTIAGAGLLIDGLGRGRYGRIIAAAGVLALGAYAYQPALLIHVLLAAVIVLVHARSLRRRDLHALGVGALLGLVILVPYVLAFDDPLFSRRTIAVSVFRDGFNTPALSTAWSHYWAQWDPAYLFLQGTRNLRNEPGMAVLVPILLPVLLVGAVRMLRDQRRPDLIVLGWLLVAPVAAALTDDGVPHFARGLLALPAIALVAGRALELVAARIVTLAASGDARDRVVAVVAVTALAVLAAVSLAGPYFAYFTQYPAASARAWKQGTSAAMELVQRTVPAGATTCIDPGVLSNWTFRQFIAWYVPDRVASVVEGVRDDRCRQPGSWLLARPGTEVPAGAVEVASIGAPASTFPFALWRVPGAP